MFNIIMGVALIYLIFDVASQIDERDFTSAVMVSLGKTIAGLLVLFWLIGFISEVI